LGEIKLIAFPAGMEMNIKAARIINLCLQRKSVAKVPVWSAEQLTIDLPAVRSF